MKYAVSIIGAGASGLMCAIEAARRGKSVVVLEHKNTACGKVLASGGGHCNFTNLNVGSEHYISENPNFVKSALSRFAPSDFIKMLDNRKILYEEKKDGQLFCKKSSRDIFELLKRESFSAGVNILTDTKIFSIKHDDCFKIKTNHKEIESDALVVASGGLSYPSLGATDIGFKIARQFKINVTRLRPVLVPLLFNQKDRDYYAALSGISFKGCVSCGKVTFIDDVLFTHRGLSGPAILQISSYWQDGDLIFIDIFPDTDIFEKIIKKKAESGKILLKNFLSSFISKRFAEIWCENNQLTESLASYPEKKIRQASDALHRWEIIPAGTEGYEKAEATRGGVDTSEISSKTMESLKVKGLYFTGEVLDVVGHLGGYNLHWAWASGHAAGQYV